MQDGLRNELATTAGSHLRRLLAQRPAVVESVLRAVKTLIVFSALAMLTAGCATPALWKRKDYSARDVTLLLSPKTGDVLVRYNEESFTNSLKPSAYEFQPRSYWLFAWTNTAEHYPPQFVEGTNFTDWPSIPCIVLADKGSTPARSDESTNAPARHPIFSAAQVANTAPEHGYYVLPGYPKFQLWKDREKIGAFKLPQRHSEWGPPTFSRVTLTPIAVVADVVGVITVLSVETRAVTLVSSIR